VLVVEDDRAVVQLLETVLEARDADVTTATTAAELRAATTSVAFDVALIDMSPIAADAVGALEALRESSPDVTIVLLTGNADAAPEVFGTDVSLIRKPFEVREVVDVLTELVRKR
jgi:DNA-binding response OmpR family regulator